MVVTCKKNSGKEHCHSAKTSTKDARDVELADSKERHREFCRGIPDVPNSAPRFDAYGKPCRGSRQLYIVLFLALAGVYIT